MEVEHVTSSPHFPQAWLRIKGNKPRNCLTNVRSMTQMFCLAFLNSSRDQTLGVPECAQRLASLCSVWCTARSGVFFQLLRSSLLPVPATTNIFSMQMKLKRMQQKASYNRAARPQQLVRLQTDKGYEKVGIVKRPTAEPRSYVGPGMWEEMSVLWVPSSGCSRHCSCSCSIRSNQSESSSFLIWWV